MTTTQLSGTALDDTLRAHLADLRIEAEEGLVQVGDRIIEAVDATSLRAKLSVALYDLWHAGIVGRAGRRALPRRDTALERGLLAATPHRTAPVPGRVGALPDGGPAGHGVVEVNRVRVLVAADTVRGLVPGDPVVLALPAARPRLTPGFFFVTGSAGGTDAGAVLRLYVHLTAAEHAPQAWRTVLHLLEARGARYRAKVLSESSAYPRRDAAVVYLPESSWQHVPELAHALAGAPGLGESTSVLARRIGPGLALAWDPTDGRPGERRMSFGQHRSTAVARGVVRHVRDDAPLHAAVAEELTAAGADPAVPARNLDSPPFPGPDPAGPPDRRADRRSDS